MFLIRALSLIPLKILYLLSDGIFFVTFYVIRYRRRVVWANLVNSFPTKTTQELRAIETLFYRNLSDYAVETLHLLSIKREDLVKRMHFVNPEVIREYTDQNQSVLILASHQFNWEWLLAAGCLELPVPVDFVYQPQASALANRLSMATRTRFGGFPVPRETVGRAALKRKDVLRATAIVADQYPGHFNHRRYWTTFLHQRTAFFHGLSQLAVLTQSAVYFAAITKVKRGYYSVELIKIASPPFTEENSLNLIDEYVKVSERIIHQQPEGWLWSHKRWKNREED